MSWKDIPMTNSIFNETLINAHVAYGKANTAFERNATKFFDTLDSEGIPWTHYVSPKTEGTASIEWFDAAKENLAIGRLTKAEYKLYTAETRSLNEAQRKAKRDLVQKVGSLMKDVKNALKRRQEPKPTSNAKGKARAPKAPSEKLNAQFESIIKTIQGNDAWEFDAADMIAAIKKLAKQV